MSALVDDGVHRWEVWHVFTGLGRTGYVAERFCIDCSLHAYPDRDLFWTHSQRHWQATPTPRACGPLRAERLARRAAKQAIQPPGK